MSINDAAQGPSEHFALRAVGTERKDNLLIVADAKIHIRDMPFEGQMILL